MCKDSFFLIHRFDLKTIIECGMLFARVTDIDICVFMHLSATLRNCDDPSKNRTIIKVSRVSPFNI